MKGHELHSIYDVKVVGDHTLRLTFEDGSIKTVDLTGFWYGRLFSPLRNPDFFRQVQLNEECHCIEWPNGADFDPETLYHWDRYRDGMIEMAKKWKNVENTEPSSLDALDLIDEHDQISLTKDIPSLGLVSGDVGTVVLVHKGHAAFEVEFITAEGHTLGVETLERNEVRPLTGNAILHVRDIEVA